MPDLDCTTATPDLEGAIAAWRDLLGAESVLLGEQVRARQGKGTGARGREVPAILLPAEAREVEALVAIAHRCQVPLHPVSTGRNWGYGDANPVLDGVVVVDLSRMTRILEVDAELGLVTLEPGVTQAMLRRHLDERGLTFMVPTSGGGPDVSLIGNALERGFGIAPVCDHVLAVMSLEAVLADGTMYRSVMSELGAPGSDRVYRWGVGPYVDGLFAQGNLGVVTRMTLALARRPERIQPFYFTLRDPRGLDRAIAAVRETMVAIGGNLGGIKLINGAQIQAYVSPGEGRLAWVGSGCLYGTSRVVAASKAEVRRLLGPHVDRLIFIETWQVDLGRRLASLLPGRLKERLSGTLDGMAGNLRLMAGEPDPVALSLPYQKSGVSEPVGQPLDPARDGCGLLWYAPIIPLTPGAIAGSVHMVERICRQHGIEPLMTLTSMSERAVYLVVPLTFDRHDEGARARARACLEALLAGGLEQGWAPYRVGIDSMPGLLARGTAHWTLVGRLNEALDPAGILAPGRYGPVRG